MASPVILVVFVSIVLKSGIINGSMLPLNNRIVEMSQDRDQAHHFMESAKLDRKTGLTFAFAKHFQSHMVLQQAPKRASIYGFSSAIGEKVIAMVTTATHKYYYSTKVVNSQRPSMGKWIFTLDPIKTSFPVSIQVSSNLGTLVLDDILFGDVWLCSGQSNMQFTVSMMDEAAEEMKNAHNFPNIRIMTVAMVKSSSPLNDLVGLKENWSLPSNTTIGGPAWSYFSAVCWLYGKALHEALGYPIGLISSNWGGTPVEAWSSPDALKKCYLSNTRTENLLERDSLSLEKHSILSYGPQNNSVLWNAMIHPLLGITLYGAIWYQGEADSIAGRVNRYNCTFPAMISDWRAKFSAASDGQTDPTFPFGFVQLAPKGVSNNLGFPEIRWHQTADMGYVPNVKMPNVFMAVAVDLPDLLSPYGDVHPRDKKDVALRLALAGLSVAYKMSEFYQGPFPVKAAVASNDQIVIDYGSHWLLKILSTEGFDMLCLSSNKSLQWIPTYVVGATNSTVHLFKGECANVVGLRYIWRETPCPFKGCAVYSSDNLLPAPPFLMRAEKDSDGKTVFLVDEECRLLH